MSSNTQLANYAKIKGELLSGPVTHAEQASPLLIRRDALQLSEEQWSALLEGLPQGLLDAVANIQRNRPLGKLSNACLRAVCQIQYGAFCRLVYSADTPLPYTSLLWCKHSF